MINGKTIDTDQPSDHPIKNDIKSINILVVGDWIIDEDWIMMPERSETSAKLSDERHYHTSFKNIEVATKRLCGASLTASALRGFLKKKEEGKKAQTPSSSLNVFGMGVWHPKDDAFLEQLFQDDKIDGANPYRICSPEKAQIKNKRLFNLAREKDICATTRVVRTFIGHAGTMPKSMARYDWHIEWEPISNNRPMKDIIAERIDKNLKEIKNMGIIFDSVVIADFNKGLINGDLIISLTEKLKESQLLRCGTNGKPNVKDGVSWFYRSKQLELPSWYQQFSERIEKNSKFIQFIDPAISKKYSVGKKLIFGNEITSEGLEFLDLYVPEHISEPKMAILFGDNSFIAYEGGEKKDNTNIWVVDSKEAPPYLARGRSSIFLASLVILELPDEKKELINLPKNSDFGANCTIALSNGLKWCHDCLNIWKKEEDINRVSADIETALNFNDICINVGKPVATHIRLKDAIEQWRQAKSQKESCCILKSNITGKPEVEEKFLYLDLWRAHTSLNDFTVIDNERKQTVINLIKVIGTFLEADDKEKRRPLVSLIKAGPGSGKTHLAKCLAKHFGLELMECNVAQLTSLDSITHFFDQVDISQRDGRKVFMFLDEVDSLVNGESTFGFLLDLMWCGQYYRNGMKNTLKPFPGIFAMSRKPEDQVFKSDHPKYPDLISRIFGINCELKDHTPSESIYLFAKLLDKYFGQIAYVEKGVLETICNTKLKYGPRSLELLISIFKGIKRNKITIENLPDDARIRELSEHFPNGLVKPSKYRKNEKELVRINYNIPF